MFARIKSLVPQPVASAYHYALARFADVWFGQPSRNMVVTGVTGTNGKTTTAFLIAKALEASGFPTGCTSTAILKVGARERINPTKMTMPGRFFLQRMLREMADAGCRYAVIETSSQGLIQSRHIGIRYDIAVFTNLTPEHIEAHGGFENYKRAKRKLFEHLASLPPKMIKEARASRAAVINADDSFGNYFAETPGLVNVKWYGVKSDRGMQATQLEEDANGSRFTVNGARVSIKLPGRYNVENALAALAVADACGIDLALAAERIAAVACVPGRFERVEAGQPFTVIIDYAPEPESFRRLYETLALLPHKRFIHVLGSCGGGRDVARRPVLGKMAAERADIVIVTNEDPYDDDPQKIIDDVADGAARAGKKDGEDLFRVPDRREAIFLAMKMARAGDAVILTGKGAETWICVANGKKIPWDEAAAAREGIGRVARDV